jgi:hypothetical protein
MYLVGIVQPLRIEIKTLHRSMGTFLRLVKFGKECRTVGVIRWELDKNEKKCM